MNVRGAVVAVSRFSNKRILVTGWLTSLCDCPVRGTVSRSIQLINKFISPYVDNLNANDLNLAIMAGERESACLWVQDFYG